MSKINIVISTYNGEKYLSQQLESIQNQTYRDWTCWIRDDGSSDETPSIIEKFCAEDDRFRFLNPCDRENFGVNKSFHTLITADPADYYFLAAQDDIMLPQKIEKYLAAASISDAATPTAWYSNVRAIDETGCEIPYFLYERAQLLPENLCGNRVGGMALMVNKALVERWKFQDYGAEDAYLALIAFTIGEVRFLADETMLYRQHSEQQTKNISADRLINFWRLIEENRHRCQLILDDYSDQMPISKRNCLQDFINLKTVNFLAAIRIISRWHFAGMVKRETYAIRILLVTKFGERKITKNK